MRAHLVTNRRLEEYNRALAELYEEAEYANSYAALMAALRKIVPHPWSSIDELQFDTGIIHREGHGLEAFGHVAAAQSEFGMTNPNVQHHVRTGTFDVIRWADLMPLHKVRDTSYYQEVIRGVDVQEQAAVVVEVPGGVLGLTVNHDAPLTDEDMQLLRLFKPHVRNVVRRARQYGALDELANLSPREREVLHWMAEGKSDQEICDALRISVRTVGQHVRAILGKLKVENRTAAAAMAWRARMAEAQAAAASGSK